MSDEVKFQIGNAVIVKPREFIPTAFEQQYTALERAGYYGVIGGIQEITGIIKATCYRVDFFGGNLYFIDEDLTLAPPDPRDEELTRLKAENERLRKVLAPFADAYLAYQQSGHETFWGWLEFVTDEELVEQSYEAAYQALHIHSEKG